MANFNAAPNLWTLPLELVEIISGFLSNRDIKSLRLTSSLVRNVVTLRLKRVFISSHPLDLKVLEEIVNHEQYRKGVVEMIWDDAVLRGPQSMQSPEDYIDSDYGCPKWYRMLTNIAIGVLSLSKKTDNGTIHTENLVHPPPEAMSLADSYSVYFDLALQQRRTQASATDLEMFKYALDRFPNLFRITISRKTHGRLTMPFYETPTIRGFPHGFMYPPPFYFRLYHYNLDQDSRFLWQDDPIEPKPKYNPPRRGLCAALRVLAKARTHSIAEFIVEDAVGLNHRPKFSEQEGYTFKDLIALVQRPGFRRLDLPICLSFLQSVCKTLKKADSLQSLSLAGIDRIRALEEQPLVYYETKAERRKRDLKSEDYLPVLSQFPVQQLTNLTLEAVELDKDRLVALLSSLTSLQSLELRGVTYRNYGEDGIQRLLYIGQNHGELLSDLRDKTDWRGRTVIPKVTILLRDPNWAVGQMVRLDSDIDKFLYGHGENPFRLYNFAFITDRNMMSVDMAMHKLCKGKGTMLDEYDPDYEQPDVGDSTLLANRNSTGYWPRGKNLDGWT